MSFLGNFLRVVAEWLGWFLKFQGNYFENISIVKESWAVFRDFTNMFFILVLIVIAFATIFDLKQYNWQGLMVRFIIAALLINFSLAIGGFLIKISTTLSNVAINQFTDITGNLAAGAGINKFIVAGNEASGFLTSADNLAKMTTSLFISSIGMIIMTVIILLAFLSALAFAVARVPVLWALLIVSPVAWISYVLPQTKRIWKNWWDWFFCWTFFMPIYLFSLVMGIAILNKRPDIGAAAISSNFLGFGAQDIFFYVLTILILVGSLAFGMKGACATGTAAAKTMGFINDRVQKLTYVSALRKGAKEKMAEIQKTGLPGKLGAFYGGERAEKLKEARVAEGIFGERGTVQAEKDRAMRDDIKTYKERFKATTDVQELEKNMKEGPREQKLAIAELLKERGELSTENMKGVYDLYREAGSDSNAIEFAKNIDYDKLSRDERKYLYENLGSQNSEIARKIVMAQAEKGDWKNIKPEELTEKIKSHASLFTQAGDKIEFLNKIRKFNMEEAVKASVDLDLTKPKEDVDPITKEPIPWTQQNQERKYTKAMEDAIKGMNMDKISELSVDALQKLAANSTTKDMISRKITPDNISAFAGKLTENQLDALKDILETKKKEFKDDKEKSAKEAAELQAESLAKALQKAQQQSGGGGTIPPAPVQPRKPIGFVPPGSIITGGEVKNPENINSNNVLDLRKK